MECCIGTIKKNQPFAVNTMCLLVFKSTKEAFLGFYVARSVALSKYVTYNAGADPRGFFTRNTPKMFAPPSARHNFFKCTPPNLKSWIRPCNGSSSGLTYYNNKGKGYVV
jgi:hypothetical protein